MSGSLLERAAEVYDFGTGRRLAPAAVVTPSEPQALAPEVKPSAPPRAPTSPKPGQAIVDREALEQGGFIVPDSVATGLAEEFRLIKRQLLQGMNDAGIAEEKRRTILVCSSQPDEGKTFCALNLALSLATEREMEVLLVDGDFNKPEILSILGIEGEAGLIDALADRSADPEAFVIPTDVPGLSVLPAGQQANNVTELLASTRAGDVLAALTARRPNRVVIFDSPPVLMASPAAVLAGKVGQAVLVVRADRTTEADLREAVGLLSGCRHLSLLLNGTGFAATGRRFGSYYGLESG